jgi:hypothetical protein
MASAIHITAAALVLSLCAARDGHAATKPCATPEHRQFDFWIGEWVVHAPNGKLAGTSRISLEYGGCVIHERYDTGRGYSGESLNIYDAPRKRWHQSWVDDDGTLLLLEGGLEDGKMVLEGPGIGSDGGPIEHRITWTPNPDGTVRQFWESTDAKGEWQVVFDGTYTPKN